MKPAIDPPPDARREDYQHIQVHVTELRQLLNNLDPAPFHSRDLDPAAEAFIVGWARDLSRYAALSLRVHVDQPADAKARQVLTESVHRFFLERAQSTRRNLRLLFQRGRTSLLIGLAFLTSALLAAELLGDIAAPNRVEVVLRETLSIGGWVAMWRPLEIFLYDWWPLRADIRLFERLGNMPVDVEQAGPASRAAD
jgi:hypothetical protein